MLTKSARIKKLLRKKTSKEIKKTRMIKLSAQVNLFYLGVVQKFAGQTL